ncbi:alpha beta hydrolase fold-3 domain containing protein [Apiospora arundinis]
MVPLWSSQPWKGLYAVYLVARAVATLPWLLARFSFRSTRPLPEWSVKICMMNVFARQSLQYQTDTRSDSLAGVLSDHRKAEKEGRFSLATPPAEEEAATTGTTGLYSHVLSPGVAAAAKPAAVGGMWYPGPPSPPSSNSNSNSNSNKDDEKVVLHFPGGAFVLALGGEEQGQDVSRLMSRCLGASTRTLLAQYRMASAAPFPAAVQDLVTVYHHVLSLGVQPQNIILSGDSAAGNLVIALLRYLEAEETSTKLPLPGGAILWSPWVHVTPTAGADYAATRNEPTDFLPPSLLQWGADAYLPAGRPPTADELPYISPLHHPFRTRVPLFVHAGGAEGFFHWIQAFAEQMTGVAGNRVRFHQTEGAPHDLAIIYQGFGLRREAEVAGGMPASSSLKVGT